MSIVGWVIFLLVLDIILDTITLILGPSARLLWERRREIPSVLRHWWKS